MRGGRRNPDLPALMVSPEHDCPYLPHEIARTLFIDPMAPKNAALYAQLIAHGFRRSGGNLYRPYCRDCHACVPLRLPVQRFRPRRSQRRAWQHFSEHEITVHVRPAEFRPEHFQLYDRYINARHPQGSMANIKPDQYMEFLACDWCPTQFIEFRLHEQLLAVAVTDVLPDALSAVYTFFDPAWDSLSPGTLAILRQIQEARDSARAWLYLGYWVPGCRKMEYKALYRPLQVYTQGRWQEFVGGEPVQIPEIRP